VTNEQLVDDAVVRVLSVLTTDELAHVGAIISLTTKEWSPATRYAALGVIKDVIGEDAGMCEYIVTKWLRNWNEHPEIHF
jgi:hypothetical protein